MTEEAENIIANVTVTNVTVTNVILKNIMVMSAYGSFSLSWAELGEGLCGDYDPNDPEDVELLRLDAEFVPIRHPAESEDDPLYEPESASYCTRVPVSTPEHQKGALLSLAAHLVRAEVHGGRSLDKAMQRVSWINPEWLTKGPDLP